MSKRRYTYQDVLKMFTNEGYEVLSTEEELLNDKGFIYAKTKIRARCPKGHLVSVNINNFMNKKRCKQCANEKLSKDKKFSHSEVKQYVESFNYKMLSDEYKNMHEKIKLLCPNNHEWEVTYLSFKNNNARCPYCQGITKYTYNEVKDYFKQFGYELLSKEYTNRDEYLSIMCPNGHVHMMTFGAFKDQDNRCPYCGRNTYEEIKRMIEKEGYLLLSSFEEIAEPLNKTVMGKTYIKIKCPNKKHKSYSVTWCNFQQGKRCPYCNESKGEKEISKVLNMLDIEYQMQYKFKDCKFYKCLPFDFYLPKYNCCIEFDGEQHYKMIDYFGGFDGFIDRIIRDTIKNEYCKENNIKLIRIRHDEIKDIKNILELELK